MPIIDIDKWRQVDVWDYGDGKVGLTVDSGDDRATVVLTIEQARSIATALRNGAADAGTHRADAVILSANKDHAALLALHAARFLGQPIERE